MGFTTNARLNQRPVDPGYFQAFARRGLQTNREIRSPAETFVHSSEVWPKETEEIEKEQRVYGPKGQPYASPGQRPGSKSRGVAEP